MSKINWVMVPGIAALAAILTLGLAGPAMALHAGGVAHCDACHSMHNSPDNPISGSPNSLLLKGTDASSTCLNCHEGTGSYDVYSSSGANFSPGGDFFWLDANYSNIVRGNAVASDPDQFGHNVIAVDFGLAIDGNNGSAPGGTYPSGLLSCASCHDPHGQVNGGTANGMDPISVSGSYGATPPAGTIAGNYRLLGDAAYGLAAAPIAVTAGFGELDGSVVTTPADPNDPNSVDQYAVSHPAYGQGMSEWCASCHGTYINDNHKHPAGNGEFLNGQATNYNQYVATGDFTGTSADSYDALVPFELQETDKAVLLSKVTALDGPDSGDNVMCLTCHRAHASAFKNITRWNVEDELLEDGYPTDANLVTIGAVAHADYYGRDIATDYGTYQRSLCNKCHVKD